MNQLPQAPCPHCQAPVAWYAPGCFNCRKPIQWPPPQTDAQVQLQQASAMLFQQQLAIYQQQQAAASSPRLAPVPHTPAPEEGGSLLEQTAYAPVQYDPQAAEDVDGFTSGTFGEFVPKDLPVQRVEELEQTKLEASGPAVLATPPSPGDEVERTAFAAVAVAPTAPVEDMELASYGAVTRAVPAATAGADPLVERTALVDGGGAAPRPAVRKKAASNAGLRICKDCGNVSEKERCPACGAKTVDYEK